MNNEEPRIRIGARVKQLREAAGMTQQSLADACGILRSNITRIEKGRYAVTIDTLTPTGTVELPS